MRRSLRPTSVITILSLCTSYLPSIVAGTLTASDGSVRSGSNSTPVYSSTTGLAPTSTSRPSTDLNTNANLDFSTNANLNANSTSTTGNDTTRLVKLQLKSNTSRCLSAIIDDDGYAQPELTLITNCTLGTTWNVSSDFAVAADDQDGDTRTSSPSRIRCQACRDDVVIDGGRLGNANGTGAALLAVEDEQSLGQL
ncbi:uncharacterized protein I303_100549 [Kwoniella dejecticola CBS 10117]|uniref:Cyanovirin-N domain-containing protein n=1 Tax=Kwoniella dejecticola CBS 10117 TaxID=1296121 RepID=A0A1A6AFD0_9TREE|nr:uncharacterized protein I303_00550 [Kwoniella dejecticola CBS 10117]OBR88733.1 hypothetical protein I303_00550 [Kwoniella dejecticola CBS 10117]